MSRLRAVTRDAAQDFAEASPRVLMRLIRSRRSYAARLRVADA